MAERLTLEQFKIRLDQVAHCPKHYIRDLKCAACVHAWDTFLQLWPHIEAQLAPPWSREDVQHQLHSLTLRAYPGGKFHQPHGAIPMLQWMLTQIAERSR